MTKISAVVNGKRLVDIYSENKCQVILTVYYECTGFRSNKMSSLYYTCYSNDCNCINWPNNKCNTYTVNNRKCSTQINDRHIYNYYLTQ